MLTARHLATVQAALLFWEEEMATNPPDFMRPLLDPPGMEPLSVVEVQKLRERFDPRSVRYAVCDSRSDALTETRLFSDSEEARQQTAAVEVVVTVLLPRPGS